MVAMIKKMIFFLLFTTLGFSQYVNDREKLSVATITAKDSVNLYIEALNGASALTAYKMPIDSLMSWLTTKAHAIGEMYIDDDSVTATGTISKYYAIAMAAGYSNGVTMTNDSTMTIVTAGQYKISYSISCTHSVNNTLIHASLFVDDVEDSQTEAQRKIGTAGDIGSFSGTGIATFEVDEEIKLKAKADKSGNLTIQHMNFNIVRLN